MTKSVIFKNVTKKYKMYNKPSEKLRDLILPGGVGEDFYALQNISFIADEGDVIGIIGVNGAGKSTLSNLITGVIPPSSGDLEIKGQSSLIAIASGLNNNLTGRENIELKCLMLGFNKKEIRELMPEIIDFAEIGKFIDQPVKSYSSGMKSRLGFAISVNVNPDVLVIDEALSVGDQTFADKCLDKMNEFKEKGKTIFFVSHSIGQVKKFCQKALWLEAGEVKAYGTIEEIIPQYEKFLKEFKAMSKEDQKNFKQIVLEKRSKLREQEKLSSEVQEQMMPRNYLRSKQKGKWSISNRVKKFMIIFVLLAIVLGGTGYVVKSGLLSIGQPENIDTTAKQQTESPIVKEKKIEDIRYVTSPSAYIRSNPNLNSQTNSIATFGQAFIVEQSHKESLQDIEWLKVTNKANQEGWISSRIMTTINEELDDEEVTDKIDQLIGFYPSLNEAIPMIGIPKGKEQLFSYTEYLYLNNRVEGFMIKVNDSSQSEVINELGEPQLIGENIFLYHGSTHDFIFTVLGSGTINTLTVIGR